MISTHNWAQSLGISTAEVLPPAATAHQHYFRSASDVAVRALLVQGVAAVAFGVPASTILAWLESELIADQLTPRERAFLTSSDQLSAEQRSALRWQQEAEWALLWAIGYVEALGLPMQGCDTRRLVDEILPPLGGSIRPFLKAARLRSQGALIAEDDRTYNLWSAVAAARRSHAVLPADLIYPVLHQRRYAFEWLATTGSWDDVICDA
jgi:hypothetical protein